MGYSWLSLIRLLAADGATVSRCQAWRAISYEAADIIAEARPGRILKPPGIPNPPGFTQVADVWEWMDNWTTWAVYQLAIFCGRWSLGPVTPVIPEFSSGKKKHVMRWFGLWRLRYNNTRLQGREANSHFSWPFGPSCSSRDLMAFCGSFCAQAPTSNMARWDYSPPNAARHHTCQCHEWCFKFHLNLFHSLRLEVG